MVTFNPSRRLVWIAYRDTETGKWGHFTARHDKTGNIVMLQNEKGDWVASSNKNAEYSFYLARKTPEEVMIEIDEILKLVDR